MNDRRRRLLADLYQAALEAVDPVRQVSRALAQPAVQEALRKARRIGVFAVGKAAAGMYRGAAATALTADRALVVLPRGHPRSGTRGAEVLFASHPEPDRASVAAARRAVRFFEGFDSGDVLLCLISGGTSSLRCLPRPGQTLEEKRRRIGRLVRSGASILKVNRLRTSLSAVKGGKLARASAARLVSLILSDVPNDRPEMVGSGPTIRRTRGDLVRIVASNRMGLEAAARRAEEKGLRARFSRGTLSGEACEAGAAFALAAKRLHSGEVLLSGGETTVRLSRRSGRGGRSLELALCAGLALEKDSEISILAAGSDGRDGTSDAAGAFADGTTLLRASALGLDAAAALRRHDTDPFLRRLGDLFVTGPTGTNVADWAFAVREVVGGRR